MIQFAHPLADEEVSKAILKETLALKEKKVLISGIRACQKYIMSSPKNAVLVLSAEISPPDLVIHLPILCEKHHVGYIFVKGSSWMNGFTCVAINQNDNPANIEKIFTSSILK